MAFGAQHAYDQRSRKWKDPSCACPPGILPEMSIEESLDVTRIYSVADQLPTGTPLIKHRPLPRAASYHFARWPGRGRQRSQAGRNIAGTQGCFVFG